MGVKKLGEGKAKLGKVYLWKYLFGLGLQTPIAEKFTEKKKSGNKIFIFFFVRMKPGSIRRGGGGGGGRNFRGRSCTARAGTAPRGKGW